MKTYLLATLLILYTAASRAGDKTTMINFLLLNNESKPEPGVDVTIRATDPGNKDFQPLTKPSDSKGFSKIAATYDKHGFLLSNRPDIEILVDTVYEITAVSLNKAEDGQVLKPQNNKWIFMLPRYAPDINVFVKLKLTKGEEDRREEKKRIEKETSKHFNDSVNEVKRKDSIALAQSGMLPKQDTTATVSSQQSQISPDHTGPTTPVVRAAPIDTSDSVGKDKQDTKPPHTGTTTQMAGDTSKTSDTAKDKTKDKEKTGAAATGTPWTESKSGTTHEDKSEQPKTKVGTPGGTGKGKDTTSEPHITPVIQHHKIKIESGFASKSENIKRVNFDTDKIDLGAAVQDSLSRLTTSLASANRVVIVGHADDLGSSEYNFQLAESRANKIAIYLESHGVDSRNIFIRSLGKNAPLVNEVTENARRENRCVEILIFQK